MVVVYMYSRLDKENMWNKVLQISVNVQTKLQFCYMLCPFHIHR